MGSIVLDLIFSLGVILKPILTTNPKAEKMFYEISPYFDGKTKRFLFLFLVSSFVYIHLYAHSVCNNFNSKAFAFFFQCFNNHIFSFFLNYYMKMISCF